MGNDHDHGFRFDPTTYDATMAAEVPAYARLQAVVADASELPSGTAVRRVLDLGTGTAATARRVLERHPGADLIGIDENADMLGAARDALPASVDLRVGRLQDPLPDGPFDLAVSALAVHHLDGAEKADLFRRVAAVLAPGGRFVLGDLIVPDDPLDVVTAIDGVFDQPSTIDEQLSWMHAAGLTARTHWVERDLAVLVGDRR